MGWNSHTKWFCICALCLSYIIKIAFRINCFRFYEQIIYYTRVCHSNCIAQGETKSIHCLHLCMPLVKLALISQQNSRTKMELLQIFSWNIYTLTPTLRIQIEWIFFAPFHFFFVWSKKILSKLHPHSFTAVNLCWKEFNDLFWENKIQIFHLEFGTISWWWLQAPLLKNLSLIVQKTTFQWILNY